MFEKVNPSHPDKVADRIAGAIVDLAYKKQENPKIAVEVLIGHDNCLIISETSVHIGAWEVDKIVRRITNSEVIEVNFIEVPQDEHLAKNQTKIRCGDNGIFKGVPTSEEERKLTEFVKANYEKLSYDGKYIINNDKIIACQSNCEKLPVEYNGKLILNPLGFWTGGINVDSGATNRKLGSDMGRCITGGGLHGKDLSKADVSVNIYAFLKAQETGKPVELHCAIGDEKIDGKPYEEIVEIARKYIESVGGFEKFAEWGLV